ncbi:MAG: winged helix-turn-helix transcriptional regulator, partial [Acidimicrobiia bacterium]|nr:winged helix-turn-helix transcriptional regulator [Acidimicrobiia bacterium]
MTKIDRTDLQILAELQSDARQTNRALAATVGLAPSTTLDRVRSMEDRGVITGYHATTDLNALGRPIQAMVAIRL